MNINNWTVDDLVKFEEKIAARFNNAEIRSPIHLQDRLQIEYIHSIFKKIYKDDWIIGAWRFHSQCLLKGVPEEEVLNAIFNGHSISLCFPEYKVFTSAIVGGCMPIAVGLALAEQMNAGFGKVWVFIGDMTAATGIVHESLQFANNYALPLNVVIEDNLYSVSTPTSQAWNDAKLVNRNWSMYFKEMFPNLEFYSYKYTSKYPHAGAGKRINF